MSTPIWDRDEITSTVAQYKDTEFAASLEAFDKRIIQAVQKGHSPAAIARCPELAYFCSFLQILAAFSVACLQTQLASGRKSV